MKLKHLLIIIGIFFIPSILKAQINDKFSDGNFTSNPQWIGDTAKFDVNTLNQLQLNAPAVTDTAVIVSASTLVDTTEWQFFVQLNFSPSTSNQLRAYIMSNQANLKSSLNGYFIQMGTSGTVDSIEFFKQQGLLKTKIAGGIKGHCGKSVNNLRIKVRRDVVGNFTLWCDTLGGNDFVQEFSVFDTTMKTTGYMGFECIYSATRSDKFSFDDVYAGSYIIDVTPPAVQQIIIIDNTNIDVLFTESVQISSAQNVANYSVDNGIGGAVNALRDASNTALVHLAFLNSFQNKNYNITISGVKDLVGNTMQLSTQPFSFYLPKMFDVVIDEIFPDPSPQISLPMNEFLEIKNTSGHDIDLFNWYVSDSSSSIQITSHHIIRADSFAIICATAAANSFASFGMVVPVNSLPSLNNDGDIMSLKDDKGNLIHSVFYNSSWYKNDIKKNGGYSLEMIDPLNPCNGENNWMASNDISGGTPGRKNSVDAYNPDVLSPKLNRVFPTTSNTLNLYFSEAVAKSAITSLTNFSINNAIGNPLIAQFSDATRQVIQLTFNQIFHSQTTYVLTIQNISDCSGNLISDKLNFEFGMPETPINGDILINEMLFNPKPYGNDFVELFNNSNKIIDLQKLFISNNSTTNTITENGYMFFPKTYIALTESKSNILQNYTSLNEDGIVEISQLPTFDDETGTVKIFNSKSDLLDSLAYSDKWHYALLSNKEGVSLERISLEAKTQDENNWHSAASVVGFATPAYKNSQAINSTITNAELELQPKVFSPDNDGKDDILQIKYSLESADYTCSVKIFDAQGNLIKTISNLQTIEQQGFFQWDGTTDSNTKAQRGIYVVFADFFNTSGKKIQLKKDCVLGGK